MNVIKTPDGIEYYRLATTKAAMKLEKIGLKHSSGRALRPAWASTLGLKPRDSYDTYIAELQKRMDVLLAAKEAT